VKVATQEIENSQVVLDIQVEDERLQKAVDQAYRRIVNRINVPGFRKGKAPRALVERMVGREALIEDAVEHLVPEVVEAAVKEQEIKMVARPKLEVVSTEPLQVKATVPVQPKVELGDYHALEIPREEAVVEDERVDSVIQRVREQNATWEPVERPVALGDRVAIDLHGEAEDKVLVDSTDAEYIVDPEGAAPAPGFADQLVGMEAEDERSFELTLPEDYRDRAVAGKPARFTVRLHWVKERRLPELDDEFASTVGTEYESMDQLRENVRNQLLEREREGRRTAHEEAVIQAVIDQAKVELPPQLVEEEAQRILDNLARTLEGQGIPIEQYLRFTNKSEAEFRAELMTQGERSVRRSEVLEAVARAEGIEATDEEIRAEIGQVAEPAEAERLLGRPDAKERIAAVLRRRKAARYLLKTVGGVDDDAESEPAATSEEPGETSA
jgi:trigger factor